MYSVKINLDNDRGESKLLRNIEPGQTLLEVCLQNKIDLHFNCGGVCSCTTCHILLHKGEFFLDEKSRRENDFVKKARDVQANSRLACQCLLLDDEGEIEITIPDQINLT